MKEYFSQDITFCSKRDCKRKTCKRNKCHIRWDLKPYHSFADFENTQYCPKKRSDNNADVVEVVRCKDCKWLNEIGCAIRIVDDSDNPKEDDFCSFGERKDDAE